MKPLWAPTRGGRIREAMALTIGLTLALPLTIVLFQAIEQPGDVWIRLWRTRIPTLLLRSISLAIAVGTTTLVVGVTAAWIVTRYEFLGRRLLTWLLAAPLAVPPYILAFVAMDLFGSTVSAHRFLATVAVLSLATYPYVYLLTRSTLLAMHGGFEEVARSTGARPNRVLRKVVLPMIRPGIAAGLFLVVLYTLADFGAVSVLGYQTFTLAIYLEYSLGFALGPAAALATILVGLALLAFLLERRFRRQARFYQTEGAPRPIARRQVGPITTGLIWLVGGSLFAAGFGVVVGRLTLATASGWDPGFAQGLWRDLTHTLILACSTATLAILLAFIVAHVAHRHRGPAGHVALRTAYAGYVLPGPIVAVGILLLATHFQVGAALLQTVALLIAAYLVRFLPQALQSTESVLEQLAPSIEEVGRSSGARSWQILRQVTLPLARPGLIAGWVLVFLATARELPATLMLRPFDYDTLAVRVWQETANEYYSLASPAALALILVCLPAASFILSRQLDGRRLAT